MTLRALSGETENGGGRRGSTGVQIVRGVKSVGGWMYVDTLTEFVLPRLREFPGLLLPPSSTNLQTPAHAI
ncbi:hypothetical protein F5888DRAFT_1810519 [Russula emetica]|nr:hypothetical protein F5888DRAFT_1810519 [Russula emetica]